MQQDFYAETLLKWCYSLPIHACSIYFWYKNTCVRTKEVIHRNLGKWDRYFDLFVIGGLTWAVGNILSHNGDPHPYADAFTTIASIYGAWFMLNRYAEMWAIFIGINIVTIYMWGCRYLEDGANPCTLIMWIVWLINAIWGWYRWNKT